MRLAGGPCKWDFGFSGSVTDKTIRKYTSFGEMKAERVEYDTPLWAERDAMREKRIEARLQKQAAQRGYKLVPLEPAA